MPTSLAALLAGAGLAAPLFLRHRVALERPVLRGIQFGLDGEHKLDCLITDGNTGMAIEVKLALADSRPKPSKGVSSRIAVDPTTGTFDCVAT